MTTDQLPGEAAGPGLGPPGTGLTVAGGAEPTTSRRRHRRYVVAALTAMFLLVLLLLPTLLPYGPDEISAGPSLDGPSLDHPFGTDSLGRDLLARVSAGARISLAVGFAAAAASLLIGGLLGAVAAVAPRWIGEPLMRLLDIMLSFPGILLAVVLAAAIGPSAKTTIIVLAIIYVPSMARVVRAAVYNEYGADYVVAARLIASPRHRLLGYHIGANAALPVLVFVTLVVGDAIVAEAALSFVGAGIQPPAASWGNIIRDGQAVATTGAWWVATFPGLAIVLSVVTMNRVAEVFGQRLGGR